MPHRKPWEIEAARCAKRTRDELIEYAPRRPLALRDRVRISAMHGRCETCGACPLVIRALEILNPPEAKPSAEIIRLAG